MNNRLMIVLTAFGLMLTLPAAMCAQTDTQNVAPVSGGGVTSNTLVDERALYTAESVYNVAAHAYVTLDGQGQLPPALKARVRPLLVEAYAALQAARSAYTLGDAGGFADKITAVHDLATRARALLPSPATR